MVNKKSTGLLETGVDEEAAIIVYNVIYDTVHYFIMCFIS